MRILISICTSLFAISIYLYLSKSSLENKLRLAESKNINLTQAIEFQNQSLQKMRLQTQSYNKNEAKRDKQIISAIQAIPAPVSKDGTTCEEAINYIIKLESL